MKEKEYIDYKKPEKKFQKKFEKIKTAEEFKKFVIEVIGIFVGLGLKIIPETFRI